MGKLPKSIAKKRRELLSQIRKTADDVKRSELEAQLAAHISKYEKKDE